MANFESSATAVWNGDLTGGSGTVDFGTGALPGTPLTWASRTESSDGKTSPEELVAAAHASCYAMAFSNVLATAGHQPDQLHVSATVAFGPKDGGGGFEIKSSALTVRGKVSGLDQSAFEKLATEGEQGCPISNALRGNIDITVNATLEA